MPPFIHLTFVMVEILGDKQETSIKSFPSWSPTTHTHWEHGKLPSIGTHVGAGCLLTQNHQIT